MNKSRAKNKYVKLKSRENFLLYKAARNKCNSMNRKVKKEYFKQATSNGNMSGKDFWKTMKPFLTNKGAFSDSNIAIETENEEIVNNEETS